MQFCVLQEIGNSESSSEGLEFPKNYARIPFRIVLLIGVFWTLVHFAILEGTKNSKYTLSVKSAFKRSVSFKSRIGVGAT